MLSHEETEEGSYEGDVDREDGVPADELDELGGYEAKAEADEGGPPMESLTYIQRDKPTEGELPLKISPKIS